jgi:hypothetical protein
MCAKEPPRHAPRQVFVTLRQYLSQTCFSQGAYNATSKNKKVVLSLQKIPIDAGTDRTCAGEPM